MEWTVGEDLNASKTTGANAMQRATREFQDLEIQRFNKGLSRR